MGWTKRQLIEQAFEEVGLASYVYDLTADQLSSALRKLDTMMSTWDGKGIKVGFPVTSNPDDSSLDTVTNVPHTASAAIYLNLGIRIAPSFGKSVSQDTKRDAKGALSVLQTAAAMPQEMQFPGTVPAGAGNRSWQNNRPFLNTPDTSPIRTDDNGQLIFSE